MEKVIFSIVCLLVGLTTGLANASEEPKWFPDLMCHPDANKEEIDELRKEAKACDNLEKDDPFLRYCVFKSWNMFLDEDFTFCPNRVGGFFFSISNNQDYANEKGWAFVKCKQDFDQERGITFKGEKLSQSRMCHNRVFDCMESLMNCPASDKKDEDKVKEPANKSLFDVSCHPEYNPHAKQDLEVAKTESQCQMLFKGYTTCSRMCAKRGYPISQHDQFFKIQLQGYTPKTLLDHNPFYGGMKRYIDGTNTENAKYIEEGLQKIQRSLFGYDPNKKDSYGFFIFTFDSVDLAKKVASSCMDAWMSTIDLDWENCEQEQAK